MKVRSGPGEAIRYLNNARGILRRVPVEGDIYVDCKPVREAMGTAYLALHIAGYYRGLIYDRKIVREALNAAQSFIEKVA